MYINTIHIICFDTSRGLAPVQAIPVPVPLFSFSITSCRRRFIYGDDERILCLRGLFQVSTIFHALFLYLFRSSYRRMFIYGDDERILCLRGLFHVYAAGIYMCLFGNGYVRCVTLTNLNRDSLCTREQLTHRTISSDDDYFFFLFQKNMNLFYIFLFTISSQLSDV